MVRFALLVMLTSVMFYSHQIITMHALVILLQLGLECGNLLSQNMLENNKVRLGDHMLACMLWTYLNIFALHSKPHLQPCLLVLNFFIQFGQPLLIPVQKIVQCHVIL